MRKPLSLSAGIVLLAAGFAAASIATGGSLAAVSHVWTTMTGTNRTATITTTGPSGRHGRGIEICQRFRRGHRYGTRTIVVDFRSLHHWLGRGSKLGPCVVVKRHHRRHGHGSAVGHGKTGSTTTTTTTVATTTTSGFVGKGTTGAKGDDQGDDDGPSGHNGNWNSFVPSFGKSGSSGNSGSSGRGHHRH